MMYIVKYGKDSATLVTIDLIIIDFLLNYS
jgi:hypothetical protein